MQLLDVPRTLQDYANTVPLGRVRVPDWGYYRFPPMTIESVESRDDHVVATFLWEDYPHPVSIAILPEDALVMGGDIPAEEAALSEWAPEAVVAFARVAEMSLTSSRRVAHGSGIEVFEADEADPRYISGHISGTAPAAQWHEAASWADPQVPPATVEQWRQEASLISWHHVSLTHQHVLPVFGHAAVRWVGDGVASVDFLDLSPGLPETFGVLTVADAIQRAACAGARTIVCTVDVPRIELLGFRVNNGLLEVDNKFLDIDYGGLAKFVAITVDWTPPVYVQSAIERNNRTTYVTG
jgi:hypothetical protein